ncbi:hypothetical protein OG552_01945 [Streptomyces sp. NBC_01476]|uniref:hypothetical protein n=1 Tax=Streptomyces sp. NBC_01476 TaxID=2903881 RepID=UPI002E310949|nr:hypothetical protein [Streptomyces sp. NBC_01476]
MLPVAVVGGLILWRTGPALAWPGLLSGAGVLPLYVAFLNRSGPGTVCTSTHGGQSCTDEYTPWPLLAAGLLLLLGGVLLHRQLLRRGGRPAG